MRGKFYNMDDRETRLEPPQEFPFPFTPYSIQKDLMRSLYETLEGRKLGIFESPTGTGKSMSMICGSLKWLIDSQERIKKDVEANIQKLNSELIKESMGRNWLEEQASQAKSKQKRDSLHDFLNKIISMENRLEEVKEKARRINKNSSRLFKQKSMKEPNNSNKSSNCDEADDSDVLLDDYTSAGNVNIDKLTDSEYEIEEEKDNYYCNKVFLCSRTHSQLSQLVKEVQKSPYKDLEVRVVSLASRQNYCINESILNLKYLPLINEKCQEMHSKKKGKSTKRSSNGESIKRQKTTGGCPFYHRSNVDNLRVLMLTQIQDVEQLVNSGKAFNGCPYYASRHAINEAQLILVPYNTLLHKSTRAAYGINLKDAVVIIDEAHNLLDTIGNIHSCSITGQELAFSHNQLVHYRDKYSERFSALNLLYLNQLIFIVNKLLKKMGWKADVDHKNPSLNVAGVNIETIPDFILSSEIDTINLYKVLEFVTKSNVVNKVQGFLYKYGPCVVIRKKTERGVSAFLKTLTSKKEPQPEEENEESESVNGNPLVNIVNFIKTLTNNCLDGRIVCNYSKTVAASSFKYLLLNPASHFSDIVKEARSVVLAGGTMQPMSEFTEQLFYLAGGTLDRIRVFTCGHIIPESSILPITVSTGPSGKLFDLSYRERNNTEIIDELGRLLINVCNIVPGGVVCFFPSYEYECLVYEHFLQTKVVEKLSKKKKVLREPKKTNKVEEVLRDYGAAVKTQGGLLFSVVGGKLSEGLNFSDDLGRCVIVVGLPYPNLTSVELKEKMNYLNATVGPSAGKTYYENLCMKAVNQSIGRSIRHKGDYASVLLIDQRYARPKCIKALPAWIQKSLKTTDTFGAVISLLAGFFACKKASRSQMDTKMGHNHRERNGVSSGNS